MAMSLENDAVSDGIFAIFATTAERTRSAIPWAFESGVDEGSAALMIQPRLVLPPIKPSLTIVTGLKETLQSMVLHRTIVIDLTNQIVAEHAMSIKFFPVFQDQTLVNFFVMQSPRSARLSTLRW